MNNILFNMNFKYKDKIINSLESYLRLHQYALKNVERKRNELFKVQSANLGHITTKKISGLVDSLLDVSTQSQYVKIISKIASYLTRMEVEVKASETASIELLNYDKVATTLKNDVKTLLNKEFDNRFDYVLRLPKKRILENNEANEDILRFKNIEYAPKLLNVAIEKSKYFSLILSTQSLQGLQALDYRRGEISGLKNAVISHPHITLKTIDLEVAYNIMNTFDEEDVMDILEETYAEFGVCYFEALDILSEFYLSKEDTIILTNNIDDTYELISSNIEYFMDEMILDEDLNLMKIYKNISNYLNTFNQDDLETAIEND